MSSFFGQKSGHHHGSAADRASSLPAFFDVARQQSELITWVGTKIVEHEQRMEMLTQEVKALAERPVPTPHDHLPVGASRSAPHQSHGHHATEHEHSSFQPKKWQASHRDLALQVQRNSKQSGRRDSEHDGEQDKDSAHHHHGSHSRSKGSKSHQDHKGHDRTHEPESPRTKGKAKGKPKRAAARGSIGMNDSKPDSSEVASEGHDDTIHDEGIDAPTAPQDDHGECTPFDDGSIFDDGVLDSRDAPAPPPCEGDAVESVPPQVDSVSVASQDAPKEVFQNSEVAEGAAEKPQDNKQAGHEDVLEESPPVRSCQAAAQQQSKKSSPSELRTEESTPSAPADDGQRQPRDRSEGSGAVSFARAYDGADLARYALSEDMDRKFNDFSDFMNGELERLDEAICRTMEHRMRDAIAAAIKKGVEKQLADKMSAFAEDVKVYVDDQIGSSVPPIVNSLTEGLINEFSSDGPSRPNARGQAMQDPLALPATGQLLPDPFSGMIVTPRHFAHPAAVSSTTPSSAPASAPHQEHTAASQQVASPSSELAHAAPGADAVHGGNAPPTAGAPTASATPLSPGGSAPAGAMVSGLAPGIVVSAGAAPATPPQKQAARGGISAPASTQNNDYVVHAIKQLHAEINRRLPPVEQALTDLKPLRLQMPTLQSDMDNLSMSVAQIAQAMEEEGNAVAAKHGSPDLLGESDVGTEDAMSVQDGAGAGAHAPPPGIGEHPDKARRISNALRQPISVGAYMGVVHHECEVDKESFYALLRRLDKLEEESKSVDKFDDLEQLCLLLEDRVKELDYEYRSHKKEVTLRLELQKSAEEKEAESANRVYESWDLDNQVDVIQSVVAQEMRSVRVELDNSIKAMTAHIGDEPHSPRRSHPHQHEEQGRFEPPRHHHSVAAITFTGGKPHRARRSNESAPGDRSRSPSPGNNRSIEETEEKVKRLQEAYQQATLKIAGLKSANRHTDQQVSHVVEQMRRMTAEMEDVASRAMKSETRLDYLTMHSVTQKASNFQVAVAEGNEHLASSSPRLSHSRIHPPTPSHQMSSTCPSVESPQAAQVRQGRLRRVSTQGQHLNPDVGSNQVQKTNSTRGITETMTTEQDDINTGRIARLGKKVNDLDGDMNSQFDTLKKDFEILSERTNMITTFLPRRLRRMVERVLTLHKKEDGLDDDKVDDKRRDNSSSKHVNFSEKAPDVQTFNVEVEKERVPWQYLGEPDQKWNWCLQPRNEMGRDLARYFEQLEQEREEDEESFGNQVEQLRQEMLLRLENVQGCGPALSPNTGDFRKSSIKGSSGDMSPTSPSSPVSASRPVVDWGQSGTGSGVSMEGFDKLSRRMEKVLLPQMQTLEDRVERLVKDMAEVRQNHHSIQQQKADKDEIQLIRMRLAPFEKFDPKELLMKLENFEVEGKHYLHLIDQLAEQVRKVEGYAANRQDVTKARAEVTGLRGELQKLQGEQKEAASSIFHSNRQISTILLETKSNLEKHIAQLEIEKISSTDHVQLQDKVAKLEGSMRDNRQILSDSGSGAEVNQIVKRIILNMEDKIMILEKKMDVILEGRATDDVMMATHDGAMRSTTGSIRPSESVTEAIGLELSTMSQAVNQLRQDVNLSKLSMDHIQDQQSQATEMAQRLNIIIDDGEVGTTLSLNRVQVMVAAAARQLVAGSKWVTQEAFDMRFGDLQKQFLGFVREVQVQVEDVHLPKQIVTSGAPKKLPNLAKKPLMEQEDGWDTAYDKAGARLGLPKTRLATAPAPNSAMVSVKPTFNRSAQNFGAGQNLPGSLSARNSHR